MRTRRFASLIAAAALGIALRADVVVSPSGSDSNPGTEDQPVKSLEQARTIVRNQGGGTVWLRGGEYRRTSTLMLGPQDSGTLWRSWPGEEARITGGAVLTGFEPSSTGPGIYQVSLPAAGIADYGKLRARGFGRASQAAALELFYKGAPMPLAGWPDVGWAYTTAAPAGPQGGMFSTATARLARWKDEPDLWVHGYWTYDWADSHEHVASIDVARGILRTDPPHGVYGYAAGKRFRVENAMSELDSPGEWYLDRSAGILYFYAPDFVADGDVVVSLLETPLVSVTDGQNIHFLGMDFEYTRGNAVEINGGSNVTVSWCLFRAIGIMAVSVQGGSKHLVQYSEIYDTGEGGLVLDGGDRPSLTPAGHVAQFNHFERFSRWLRTYTPAIELAGVGQSALRNRIHVGPHQAIAIDGNDHIVEGNDIHTVGWETSDVGAFYMGRDLTWRGNAVRSNYFHNLGNNSAYAVYLDDCAAGTTVEQNIFHRAGINVMIGGGRDNTIRNNLFLDGNPAILVDARGLTWAQYWFNGKDPTLMNRLNAMPYKTPPWSDRYPSLANILKDQPATPKGNVIQGNASYTGTLSQLLDNTGKWIQQTANIAGIDPGFVDPAANDFSLRTDSPLYARGFQPLGFTDLGDTGDIINYRVESVEGQSTRVRVVVENLGRAQASGKVLLWGWPESLRILSDPVGFSLAPGQRFETIVSIQNLPSSGPVLVGARLQGSGLTPLPLTIR